ncbi:MAG: cupin domain-containing protein [Myxococcota bacterium]|nr:cupin domain-containing protein [Myxococcota bacterium]
MTRDLSKHPVHLGRGATAVSEPEFTGSEWYEGYGTRHQSDGKEGRLVSMYTFESSWDTWEVHPEGSELVLCTAGELTLVQEVNGREVRTVLRPGEYAINDPGIWHTADVTGPATAVFVTAGLGTAHRPRTRSGQPR